MTLDADAVRRLAELAGLRVAAEDEAGLAEALERLVRFVERMPDGGGAQAPAMGVTGREDVPGECLGREAVLANAPETMGGLFRVPAVPAARQRGGDG
jgi:aspartyl/glutamyl-tRNA(Asn/Gln) amidotransferase C subunit